MIMIERSAKAAFLRKRNNDKDFLKTFAYWLLCADKVE